MSLPTEGKESLPHEICRIAMACCEAEGESIEGNVETVNDHGYIAFRGAAYLSAEHHSFSCSNQMVGRNGLDPSWNDSTLFVEICPIDTRVVLRQ